jgi:hypothetical protein
MNMSERAIVVVQDGDVARAVRYEGEVLDCVGSHCNSFRELPVVADLQVRTCVTVSSDVFCFRHYDAVILVLVKGGCSGWIDGSTGLEVEEYIPRRMLVRRNQSPSSPMDTSFTSPRHLVMYPQSDGPSHEGAHT